MLCPTLGFLLYTELAWTQCWCRRRAHVCLLPAFMSSVQVAARQSLPGRTFRLLGQLFRSDPESP